jgi:uncharacterized protein (DUF1501 family)
VRLSDGLGSTRLRGLEPQWKKQRLAVVSGVGYHAADYSHFRATEIWQTAEPKSPTWGWIGRASTPIPERALRIIAIGRQLALSAATPGAATLDDFARFACPRVSSPSRASMGGTPADGARGEAGRAGQEAIVPRARSRARCRSTAPRRVRSATA